MSALLSLDEEVRLYTTNSEREKYESLATLYGIIVALDYLERAYVRDSVTAVEYSPACTRLLSQCKTTLRLVGEDVPSIEQFMSRYRMDHPAALHRLQVGVPATVEHSSEAGPETGKWVAETTQSFITFMDALKLRLRAKDQLHPILQELVTGYARFKGSKDWEGRSKMVGWLITLNGMKASEEITEEQSRQLLFDVDHAFRSDVDLFNVSDAHFALHASTQLVVQAKKGKKAEGKDVAKPAQGEIPADLDFFKYAKGGPSKRKTRGQSEKEEASNVKRRKVSEESQDEQDDEENGDVETQNKGSASTQQRHRVATKGSNVPAHAETFAELNKRYRIPSHLMANLEQYGYQHPTGIQSYGCPILLESRDLAAISPTGTGKTLSYLLPVMANLGAPISSLKTEGGKGVRAVILAPTRELAHQIYNECLKLAQGRKWRIVLFSKATAATIADKSVRDNVDIIISTPLRLVASLQSGNLELSNVQHLILDEADRMLDAEFISQVQEVAASCTHENMQKAVFSATLPANAEKVAMDMLRNPPRAASLAEELVLNSVPNVDCLHAGMSKKEREDAVSRMRRGESWVMVSTEVMARGMDFKGVREVINYDFPQSVQSYVHRIGRTGRAGREGKAITYFTNDDAPYLKTIANVLLQSGSSVPEWILKLPKPSKLKRRDMGKIGRPEAVNPARRMGRSEAMKKRTDASPVSHHRDMIAGSKRRKEKAGHKDFGKPRRSPDCGKFVALAITIGKLWQLPRGGLEVIKDVSPANARYGPSTDRSQADFAYFNNLSPANTFFTCLLCFTMPAARNVRRSHRLRKRPQNGIGVDGSKPSNLDSHSDQDPTSGSTIDTTPTSTHGPDSKPTIFTTDFAKEVIKSCPPLYALVSGNAHEFQTHGRKKRHLKEGHIPRPPNAFLIFRSHLCSRKVTRKVEHEHSHISRIGGHCWRGLTEPKREPYKQMAKEAQRLHAALFPHYKYAPVWKRTKSTKRKVRRNGEEKEERCKTVASLVVSGVEGRDLEMEVKRLKFPGTGRRHTRQSSRTTHRRSSSTIASPEATQVQEGQIAAMLPSDSPSTVSDHSLPATPILPTVNVPQAGEEACALTCTNSPDTTVSVYGKDDEFDPEIQPPHLVVADYENEQTLSSREALMAGNITLFALNNLETDDSPYLPNLALSEAFLPTSTSANSLSVLSSSSDMASPCSYLQKTSSEDATMDADDIDFTDQYINYDQAL
ncbi:hypothetical protein EW146_g3554 [Bondarzewia mesenterica]|uniref:RNA helicase n=1 Tax=Bondarzewia mesenterica TaxID=1095465 RepID=A0A4V3XFE4_9AGAM|nr:hypothetical protein EW146_g3554 [Bondarzewia mesenterica]